MRETIQRLESAISAVLYRLKELETNARQTFPECYQAQAVAGQIGLDPKIVCRRGFGSAHQRTQLIRELRARKWPVSKVARALGICEKTIERAIHPPPAFTKTD